MTESTFDQDKIIESLKEECRTWDRKFKYYHDKNDSDLCHLFSEYSIDKYTQKGILCFMGLHLSKDDPNLVAYFPTIEKREAGVFTKLKPGKLFRKLMPYAKDSDLESFIMEFKKAYSPREYEIIDSKDESEFIHAYSHGITQGTSHNYSGERYEIKSLSGSCMRKSFDFVHPAAAYASGDFRIIYAKEKGTGLIGARVVVGNDSAGPVYTNCNHATKAIEQYLITGDIDSESSWEGLALQKRKVWNDKYLCPYLDGYSSIQDNGDSFIIGKGNITFHTQGYVTLQAMVYCESCENEEPESGMYEVHGGGCVCYDCRSNNYTYSNLMGEYIPDSDCVSVNYDVATQEWLEENDYILCEHSEEYHLMSDCIEYEGSYYWKHCNIVSEIEGDYYHEDSPEYQAELEKIEKEEQLKKEAYETITTSKGFQWFYNHGEFTDWYTRYQTPYIQYTETTETRLRLNYELDSNGLPYRLPEFNFA